MKIYNNTISFDPTVEREALAWMQDTYMPLLESCPLIHEAIFCVVATQNDSQNTFAIQLRFTDDNSYKEYCDKYKEQFAQVLYLKFKSKFGVFSTLLTKLF